MGRDRLERLVYPAPRLEEISEFLARDSGPFFLFHLERPQSNSREMNRALHWRDIVIRGSKQGRIQRRGSYEGNMMLAAAHFADTRRVKRISATLSGISFARIQGSSLWNRAIHRLFKREMDINRFIQAIDSGFCSEPSRGDGFPAPEFCSSL